MQLPSHQHPAPGADPGTLSHSWPFSAHPQPLGEHRNLQRNRQQLPPKPGNGRRVSQKYFCAVSNPSVPRSLLHDIYALPQAFIQLSV